MAITQSGVYWVNMEKAMISTLPTSYESTSCTYWGVTDGSTSTDGNFDAVEFRSDASLVEGTNMTADPLVSPTIALATPLTNQMNHDFADPQWTSITTTVMGGIVTSGDATDTADEVYYLQDFVTAASTTSGTLDVAIHADGALVWS